MADPFKIYGWLSWLVKCLVVELQKALCRKCGSGPVSVLGGEPVPADCLLPVTGGHAPRGEQDVRGDLLGCDAGGAAEKGGHAVR